jgi:serine/threonine protein kinase
MKEWVGKQLGNYRLIRLLGQGGFADVYLGEHIYLKTQAAVKVLQVQLTQDSLNSFLAEARTIASLKHPHKCAGTGKPGDNTTQSCFPDNLAILFFRTFKHAAC